MSDPRVTDVVARAAAPVRVAVCGRRGVGRGTVARALTGAGVPVTVQPGAEVVVYVIAEAAKPEDTDAVAALPGPVLLVFNKADLSGSTAGGAVAAAQAGCSGLATLAGAPAEPLAALLAVAAFDNGLDDTLWSALRVLAAAPAGLGSVDDFVAGPHRLPRELRLRLTEVLDISGIAQAVAAIRRGGTAVAVRALLRRSSGIDGLVGRIVAAGAETRYRRILDAVTELEALAVGDPAIGTRIGDFLASDDVVSARMAAAVDVVEAAGCPVDTADDADGHLRRAAAWQRYSRGPVTAVHRACGGDITRGSLRLWAAEGPR